MDCTAVTALSACSDMVVLDMVTVERLRVSERSIRLLMVRMEGDEKSGTDRETWQECLSWQAGEARMTGAFSGH